MTPAIDDTHARAAALVSHPKVPVVIRQEVGIAARGCPHLADEFEAHAWLALWAAALKHAGTASAPAPAPWPSYLATTLRGDLRDFLRYWLKAKAGGGQPFRLRAHMASLDCRPDDGDGPAIGDTIPSDDLPVGWEMESEDAARALIDLAPPPLRAGLRAMFLECPGGGRTAAGPKGRAKYVRRYGVKRIGENLRKRGISA